MAYKDEKGNWRNEDLFDFIFGVAALKRARENSRKRNEMFMKKLEEFELEMDKELK